MHVDVSKQRFDLPTQVSDALKEVLTYPKEYAHEILGLCSDKYKEFESKEEGGSFNERNSELVEEDSLEVTEVIDKDLEKKKFDSLKKESKELQEQLSDLKNAVETDDKDKVIPKKLRYSEKVVSQNLWEVGFDADFGAYVVINKNHPYYNAVLRTLNESSSARQSIEALFWSFAAAERIVRTRLNHDDEVIKDIVERFKLEVGYNITHWVRSNIDLFD